MESSSAPPLEMEDAKRMQREDENAKAIEKIGPAEIRNYITELIIPTDTIIDPTWDNDFRFIDSKEDEIVCHGKHPQYTRHLRFSPSPNGVRQFLRGEGTNRDFGTNIFMIVTGWGHIDESAASWIRHQSEENLRKAKWIAFKFDFPISNSIRYTAWHVDFEAQTVKHLEFRHERSESRATPEQLVNMQAQIAEVLKKAIATLSSRRDAVLAVFEEIAKLD